MNELEINEMVIKCPACSIEGQAKSIMREIEIPHFGNVLETTIQCPSCGFKHSDIIADEYGNTERMTELTSICLYPIPFKMSTFVDYVAFYLELQEDLKRRYREV